MGDFLQWNVVKSNAKVLRGVHVHVKHADYLVLASGRALVGMQDLRKGSPTFNEAMHVELAGSTNIALSIPPGIAHGFYFYEPSIHVYAVSHYWNLDDELGCRFDDEGLNINWPDMSPVFSERDRQLPRLEQLMISIN